MTILSSFYLDPLNDTRIAEAAAALGGRYLPSPREREDREAHVDARIAEADILLGGRITTEQLSKAEHLRWIHVPWAGVNSLLATPEVRERTLLITNASGVMSESVADQVMGYVVMLNRDLAAQVRAQMRGEWARYETESPKRQLLRGKTIGLLGFGAIGRAVTLRASAFGMSVIAWRRGEEQRAKNKEQRKDEENGAEVHHDVEVVTGSSGLKRILSESDFVVVALPLTEGTRGLIGDVELAMMKPTSFFINIARGAVVRELELIEALRSNTIAGAALDVFEQEPLPADSPFWRMENVIVTPHSAGAYMGYQDTTVSLFIENLRRYAGGEPLRNLVDVSEGY